MSSGYDTSARVRSASSTHTIFYLWYNADDGRYQRGDYGLHCGDCLEALVLGTWIQTRVEHTSSSEHSHGWYLYNHPKQPLEGLAVRKEARP